MMNPELQLLQPYPFEKLNALKDGIQAPENLSHIALSIGEPKNSPPEFVLQCLADNLDKLANYPSTKGMPELRSAIGDWATKRFQLKEGSLCPHSQVLPVNGTREALFAIVQTIVDRTKARAGEKNLVIFPNPFYQIYEGATLLAGATPHFLNCTADKGYIPDFDGVDEKTWNRCQLLFLCSPGNPTGAVIDSKTLQKLIALADKHDFIIASDECYSELYFDEDSPPVGLLQACAEMGRHDFDRCVVFHSLSKRSNLPGLRSGFVAGDEKLIASFLKYRTYHGCAMPLSTQIASIAAWSDEEHVFENRCSYRQKFDAVLAILGEGLNLEKPDAGFYFWPRTPIDDQDFARRLFQQQNVTVLPGSFLARDTTQGNPGKNHIRMALVASVEECISAAQRINQLLEQL